MFLQNTSSNAILRYGTSADVHHALKLLAASGTYRKLKLLRGVPAAEVPKPLLFVPAPRIRSSAL
jgi:hypothetical protein